MTMYINDASALVKKLRSEIIACGRITCSKEDLKNNQKLKIETILQQWTLASNEASKAAELIEAKRVKTQEALIRIAADSLSQGEERLAQFLRHAVTIKMLRKSQFEIAKAEREIAKAERCQRIHEQGEEYWIKAAEREREKLHKLERFLSKTRAATARARAERRVAARAERRTAETRMALEMGADNYKREWSEYISEKDRVAKERYNIDMAIEAAHKASDIYEKWRKENPNYSYGENGGNELRMKAKAAGDKAIFLSVIKIMDSVGEKFKKNGETEAYYGIQWQRIRSHLISSIIWCEKLTAKVANGQDVRRDRPPEFRIINW